MCGCTCSGRRSHRRSAEDAGVDTILKAENAALKSRWMVFVKRGWQGATLLGHAGAGGYKILSEHTGEREPGSPLL